MFRGDLRKNLNGCVMVLADLLVLKNYWMDCDPFILLNGWIQSDLLTICCFLNKLSRFFYERKKFI